MRLHQLHTPCAIRHFPLHLRLLEASDCPRKQTLPVILRGQVSDVASLANPAVSIPKFDVNWTDTQEFSNLDTDINI
jgi:hypothetical protein